MDKEKPLTEEELEILEKYSENELVKLAELKREKDIQVAKSNPRYQIALSYANELLARAGYNKVTQLDAFDRIDRKKIVEVDGGKLVNDMLPAILKIYQKKDINYAGRKLRKTYHISVLKYLLQKINYSLTGKGLGSLAKIKHIYRIVKI